MNKKQGCMIVCLMVVVAILCLFAGIFISDTADVVFPTETNVQQEALVVEPTEIPTGTPTTLPTQAPTKIPTKLPTSTKRPTKIPTQIPDISAVQYLTAMMPIMDDCQYYLNEVADVSTAASLDSTLFFDADWTMEMALALNGLDTCGKQLMMERDVPSGYEEIASLLSDGGYELRKSVEYMVSGIDDLDVGDIERGITHMENFTDYLTRTLVLMEAKSP